MGRSLTQEIIEAVADKKGVEPSELDFALYNYIDADALEHFADHEKGSWTLSFEIPDYIVTITNNRTDPVDDEKRALDMTVRERR